MLQKFLKNRVTYKDLEVDIAQQGKRTGLTDQNVQEALITSLSAALSDIVEGRYRNFSCSEHNLREALVGFSKGFAEIQEAQLKGNVDLSMQVNEAVIAGAEMMRSGREINERSNGMASAVQELTASVEQISSSTDKMASEATNMRDVANKGAELSRNALNQMQNVTSSVSLTVEKLDSLVKASDDIANVVGFISDIAEKTNLLALNATIEAARAGEAGKGFAVVASEVKDLANQTTQNAQQIIESVKLLQDEISSINKTIQDVVSNVQNGEEAIDATNAEMQSILAASEKITEQTQSVSNVLAEQKLASNEIAEGVGIVAQMTAESLDKINSTLDAMDVAEKILVEQLNYFVGKEIDHLTVYLAKSDHVIWKKRLANMLVERDSLNPDELADHHSCRLGKWYDTIDEQSYLSNPAYESLAEPHKRVHDHGIAAARKYKERDLKGALEEIAQVETASIDVIHLLDELIKGTDEKP